MSGPGNGPRRANGNREHQKAKPGRRRRRWVRYWILDPLEAAPVYLIMGLSWLMPTSLASNLGGWIGRQVARLRGPRLRIMAHLELAMPELDEADRDRIARGCLEHVGRLVMEAAHITRIVRNRIETAVGFENVQALVDAGRPAFCMSAHYGNWEVGHALVNGRGVPTAAFYRRPANRFLDHLLVRLRFASTADVMLIAKGDELMRPLRKIIRQRRHAFVLLDERFRKGAAVPFFGRPALTNTVIAEMALRFDVPVYFARVVRLKGVRFYCEALPPVSIPRTGDLREDARALMVAYNAQTEAWIREHPEQWIWSHRRWRLKDRKPAQTPSAA